MKRQLGIYMVCILYFYCARLICTTYKFFRRTLLEENLYEENIENKKIVYLVISVILWQRKKDTGDVLVGVT